MKKLIIIAVLYACLGVTGLKAQITTPQIKANFGVDGELRINYFNGFVVNGNDDWFSNIVGTGKQVIDTTGASFILSRYASTPASKMAPFFRTMKYAPFSVINNRLLIDAIFIRDHHGDDSTVFASGSNKNGMSPGMWSCPVSQGIPDKNDILDIMMHVRRDGPNTTDSLWMFGGVSIDNTTGNRYFDFEMYQTDILYNRATRTFMGFGPDAGHTSWKFDAAGNVTQPGDIIFTAEYSSSQLSLLEARIWVNSATLSVTPANFSWGGSFDGDGSGATFGYASILPKTAGDFYTGLQCSNNTWAGPFGLVLQNNSLVANYSAKQFMEFSVNLSKLGLDPLVIQNNACGMPFRRILVKSRASTSFTAELKDFVGPFSFFRVPSAQASADITMFCGNSGVSNICVDSVVGTSLYTWHTPNGNIVGDSVGPCITVDLPGTYIVRQQLMDSCGISYATDTVVITNDPFCVLLNTLLSDWRGSLLKDRVQLNWTFSDISTISSFEIERSIDKQHFDVISREQMMGLNSYQKTDLIPIQSGKYIYYRLKVIGKNGTVQHTRILSFPVNREESGGLVLAPNPVTTDIQLLLPVSTDQKVKIQILDQSGKIMDERNATVQKGTNSIQFAAKAAWPNGLYIVMVHTKEGVLRTKMILSR